MAPWAVSSASGSSSPARWHWRWCCSSAPVCSAKHWYRLTSRSLGFDPTSLAVVSFRLTGLPPSQLKPLQTGDYERLTPGERVARTDQFLKHLTVGWWLHMDGAMDRVAALPSVTAVGGAYSVPFTGGRIAVHDPARRSVRRTETTRVRSLSVTAGYFDVMRIPVVKGRALQASDRLGRGSTSPRPRAEATADRAFLEAARAASLLRQCRRPANIAERLRPRSPTRRGRCRGRQPVARLWGR